ncbi:MAG: type II toxin-antitoxin system VapC family toxin [Chloroflexota bacterium]
MTARPEAGLLDTSVVLLTGRLDPALLPARPMISTITLAELAAGPQTARTDAERSVRLAQVQQAEADFDALPFDAPAARAFGLVAADLRRTGRRASARAYDALIAAVALSNALPLYTCNPGDFAGIGGLAVVAVPHPDSDARVPYTPAR